MRVRFLHHPHAGPAIVILAILSGCGGSPDQRLADFARQNMDEQTRQNQRAAEQAIAVVKGSHELTEAAGHLVEHDAQTRREMIVAFRDLSTQLNDQKSSVDAERTKLELERQELARRRERAPVIASAIQGFGWLLASLLPLGITSFVVYQIHRQEPLDSAISELLITDLASDCPLIWPDPGPQLPKPIAPNQANSSIGYLDSPND